MLGAAYDPVNRLFYAVVGGGTSTTNIYREIVSYDLSNPSSPVEKVVADVSSIPLTSPLNVQLALNVASGTMQIFAKDTGTVSTVAITGTGNTPSTVAASTFPDSNFLPTYIVSNPLLGETYIASASQVDILTRPASAKMQMVLDLTGPEIQATTGYDSAIALRILNSDPADPGLATTNVTITATPQGGTNLSYPGDVTYAKATAGSGINITPGTLSMVMSAPTTAGKGTAFNVGVQLLPTGIAPTGAITVSAVASGTTAFLTLGTVSAASAAGANGATLSVTLASSGVYSLYVVTPVR